jgi:hypothetical protein
MGCWDVLATLGEWSLPKTSRQGVMWNVGVDAKGVSEVTAGCGGALTAVLGDHLGLVLSGEVTTTLGDSREFTLGGEGVGWLVGQRRRDGGASACHDSKISWREVIALSWEILVGGGAPLIGHAMTCKP